MQNACLPLTGFLILATAWMTWASDLASQAAPGDSLSVLDGFQAELIYSVPAEQGSWVSLAVDNTGRLITSDQYGKLYRVTLPSVTNGSVSVEPIPLEVGQAQGLLCAWDSLYVMVNGKQSGLYRLRDTNADDRYDLVERLLAIQGSGEHGPHAIVLAPDRKSLFICAGNQTAVPETEHSRIPRNWGEDQLLPRQWDANGHAVGRLAPGGWIARVNPDGQQVQLFCAGFRNEYDIAFNTDGELFTFDADMEWDLGAPWYRPTRVNHATSGAEFGWRSGTGKWPADYPDSLGSVIDIGPGSPTGIVFGTGARFPHKYQRALFAGDWSYGVIYAIHLTPAGSSYVAERESFVSAAPLPVTDLVVNPSDQALYFTIGGRRTQAGLYRVTYRGDQPTTPAPRGPPMTRARKIRQELETLHFAGAQDAIAIAWPRLSHEDRGVRYAARIAIEHQPVDLWRDAAFAETNPVARTHALIAVARCSEPDPQRLQDAITALLQTPWDDQTNGQRVDWMRALALCFVRLGPEDGTLSPTLRDAVISAIGPHYPARTFALNRDLSQLLVYLQAPGVVAHSLELLEQAPTQEEQIHYAHTLRTLKTGWSDALRQRYFEWFNKAMAVTRGGHSLSGFLSNIRQDAVATLSDQEKLTLKSILDVKPVPSATVAVARSKLVKQWAVADLLPSLQQELNARDFERGRACFTEASCYKCHRVAGDGGRIGPDLTTIGRRFDHKAILESIIEPSKTVSDQYQTTRFVMQDGRVVIGRVINMNNNSLQVMQNMLDPGHPTTIDRRNLEAVLPSHLSPMPTELLNTFTKQEILDMLAYLRSGGDPEHPMFK